MSINRITFPLVLAVQLTRKQKLYRFGVNYFLIMACFTRSGIKLSYRHNQEFAALINTYIFEVIRTCMKIF